MESPVITHSVLNQKTLSIHLANRINFAGKLLSPVDRMNEYEPSGI